MATKAELQAANETLSFRLKQRSRQVERAEKKAAKANKALEQIRAAYDELSIRYGIATVKLNSGVGNAHRAEVAEHKLRIIQEVVNIDSEVPASSTLAVGTTSYLRSTQKIQGNNQ